LTIDLGKQGATYRIAEEGFISMMRRRLSEVDISKYQTQMEELVIKRIDLFGNSLIERNLKETRSTEPQCTQTYVMIRAPDRRTNYL